MSYTSNGGIQGRPQTWKFNEAFGKRFGRLVVLVGPYTIRDHRNRVVGWVKCRCDCGVEKEIRWLQLRHDRTQSCGCLSRELNQQRRAQSHTPERRIWAGMIRRCSDPRHDSYRHYGGRGISVCERWRESFDAFFADMGRKPSAEHSLDRINNEGNYEPGNCRWATRSEQARNRRPWGASRRKI